MECHLFSSIATVSDARAQGPSKGFFASLGGDTVFILCCYTAWGVPMADVVPLRVEPGESHVVAHMNRDVMQCRQSDLHNIGLWYALDDDRKRATASLRFRPLSPGVHVSEDAAATLALMRLTAKSWALCDDAAVEAASSRLLHACDAAPRRILPASLQLHVSECRLKGEVHAASPRVDSRSCSYILDLPCPIPVDSRSFRCDTCRHRTPARYLNFPLVVDDIQHAYPWVLVCHVPKGGFIYMTPAFLLHIVNSF